MDSELEEGELDENDEAVPSSHPNGLSGHFGNDRPADKLGSRRHSTQNGRLRQSELGRRSNYRRGSRTKVVRTPSPHSSHHSRTSKIKNGWEKESHKRKSKDSPSTSSTNQHHVHSKSHSPTSKRRKISDLRTLSNDEISKTIHKTGGKSKNKDRISQTNSGDTLRVRNAESSQSSKQRHSKRGLAFSSRVAKRIVIPTLTVSPTTTTVKLSEVDGMPIVTTTSTTQETSQEVPQSPILKRADSTESVVIVSPDRRPSPEVIQLISSDEEEEVDKDKEEEDEGGATDCPDEELELRKLALEGLIINLENKETQKKKKTEEDEIEELRNQLLLDLVKKKGQQAKETTLEMANDDVAKESLPPGKENEKNVPDSRTPSIAAQETQNLQLVLVPVDCPTPENSEPSTNKISEIIENEEAGPSNTSRIQSLANFNFNHRGGIRPGIAVRPNRHPQAIVSPSVFINPALRTFSADSPRSRVIVVDSAPLVHNSAFLGAPLMRTVTENTEISPIGYPGVPFPRPPLQDALFFTNQQQHQQQHQKSSREVNDRMIDEFLENNIKHCKVLQDLEDERFNRPSYRFEAASPVTRPKAASSVTRLSSGIVIRTTKNNKVHRKAKERDPKCHSPFKVGRDRSPKKRHGNSTSPVKKTNRKKNKNFVAARSSSKATTPDPSLLPDLRNNLNAKRKLSHCRNRSEESPTRVERCEDFIVSLSHSGRRRLHHSAEEPRKHRGRSRHKSKSPSPPHHRSHMEDRDRGLSRSRKRHRSSEHWRPSPKRHRSDTCKPNRYVSEERCSRNHNRASRTRSGSHKNQIPQFQHRGRRGSNTNKGNQKKYTPHPPRNQNGGHWNRNNIRTARRPVSLSPPPRVPVSSNSGHNKIISPRRHSCTNYSAPPTSIQSLVERTETTPNLAIEPIATTSQESSKNIMPRVVGEVVPKKPTAAAKTGTQNPNLVIIPTQQIQANSSSERAKTAVDETSSHVGAQVSKSSSMAHTAMPPPQQQSKLVNQPTGNALGNTDVVETGSRPPRTLTPIPRAKPPPKRDLIFSSKNNGTTKVALLPTPVASTAAPAQGPSPQTTSTPRNNSSTVTPSPVIKNNKTPVATNATINSETSAKSVVVVVPGGSSGAKRPPCDSRIRITPTSWKRTTPNLPAASTSANSYASSLAQSKISAGLVTPPSCSPPIVLPNSSSSSSVSKSTPVVTSTGNSLVGRSSPHPPVVSTAPVNNSSSSTNKSSAYHESLKRSTQPTKQQLSRKRAAASYPVSSYASKPMSPFVIPLGEDSSSEESCAESPPRAPKAKGEKASSVVLPPNFDKSLEAMLKSVRDKVDQDAAAAKRAQPTEEKNGEELPAKEIQTKEKVEGLAAKKALSKEKGEGTPAVKALEKETKKSECKNAPAKPTKEIPRLKEKIQERVPVQVKDPENLDSLSSDEIINTSLKELSEKNNNKNVNNKNNVSESPTSSAGAAAAGKEAARQKEELELREKLLKSSLMKKMHKSHLKLQLVSTENTLISTRGSAAEMFTKLNSAMSNFKAKKILHGDLEKEVTKLAKQLEAALKRLDITKKSAHLFADEVKKISKSSFAMRDKCGELSKSCAEMGQELMGPSYQLPKQGDKELKDNVRVTTAQARLLREITQTKTRVVVGGPLFSSSDLLPTLPSTSAGIAAALTAVREISASSSSGVGPLVPFVPLVAPSATPTLVPLPIESSDSSNNNGDAVISGPVALPAPPSTCDTNNRASLESSSDYNNPESSLQLVPIVTEPLVAEQDEGPIIFQWRLDCSRMDADERFPLILIHNNQFQDVLTQDEELDESVLHAFLPDEFVEYTPRMGKEN